MKNLFTTFLFLIFISNTNAQIDIIHPPNWWVGFENQNLQLLVKGNSISEFEVGIDYPGIEITKIHKADSPNYLFIDLNISNSTLPGIFKIKFKRGRKELTHKYKLEYKRNPGQQNEGFDSSDVIYLITPDRFANGDYSNDIVKGLRENKIDRNDNYARHGGDIIGVTQNINYIKKWALLLFG